MHFTERNKFKGGIERSVDQFTKALAIEFLIAYKDLGDGWWLREPQPPLEMLQNQSSQPLRLPGGYAKKLGRL